MNSINMFFSISYAFWLLNILSILWVTMKPPKILIAAKNTPIKPQMLPPSTNGPDFNSNILPTIMIPLIALVTLIRGVCNWAVTFQMTM